MKKWIKRLAAVLVCLVALIAIAWSVLYFHGKSRLNAELALWRARGVEFKTEFVLADSEVWQEDERVVRALEVLDGLPEPLAGALAGPDAADPDELRQAIDASEEAVVLLREVADGPAYAWGAEPGTDADLMGELLPRLKSARWVARILCADAIVKSRAGDLAGAEASLVATLSVAERIGEYELMISRLVQLSIESLVLTNAQTIFSDSGQANELMGLIGAIDYESRLSAMMAAEARYGMVVVQAARVPTWNHDWALTLRLYRELLEAAEQDDIALRDLQVPDTFPWWSVLAKISIPAWDAAIGAMLKGQATADLADAASELRRFKSVHGAYPDDLDGIDGLPVDPFNGQPFGYRKDGEGFVLTSAAEIDGQPIELGRWTN